MIRQYNQLCSCCQGAKWMPNPNFDANLTGAELHIVCIVCNGTGVIVVTEQDEWPTIVSGSIEEKNKKYFEFLKRIKDD